MNKKKKEKSTKNSLFSTIQRNIKKYAPVAISTFFAWAPVNSVRANIGNAVDKVQKMGDDDKDDKSEFSSKLALADFNNPNAYKDAIAKISINTEVNSSNPSAVATGNGYFGQHQFGASAKAGYMVRKYIAYALTNGSPDFRESLAKNLLVGTKANKDKVIDKFGESLDEYDAKGAPEKAYMPTNLAYKRLFSIMNITNANFTKAHKDFSEEGGKLQSMFVYEVYLNLMPTNLKKIIKDYPQMRLGEVHPAIMGSIIAIAVKQGNGARLDNALGNAYYEAMQKKASREWDESSAESKSSKEPLAIAYKKGKITSDNVILVGKNILRIYDVSGKIKADDVFTDKNIIVSVIKAEKPKTSKSSRPIQTYNVKDTPINIGEIVNNRQWLRNYCSGFLKVYREAEGNLDKIPTLDTYMEMSIILNDPTLYEIMRKPNHNDVQESIIAFNDVVKDTEPLPDRIATDRERIMNLHKGDLAIADVSKASNARQRALLNKETSPTEQMIKKIINNKYRSS